MDPRRLRIPLAGTIVATSLLPGCGGDDPVEPEPPPDPPRAAAISISPESADLASIGATAQFTATISDQFGAPFQGAISWSSGAPTVFTVDANGVVTAVGNGSGSVQASFESLSATASVAVDAGAAPEARIEFPDVTLGTGGGPGLFLPAAYFTDPDGDDADLVFAVEVGDPAVASADLRIDEEGHSSIVMSGVAAGTTELTITATDAPGLSASQVVSLTVEDSDYTPLRRTSVEPNRLSFTGLIIVGGCTIPVVNLTTRFGALITVSSSKWQTRSDAAGEWADIEGTERTTGVLCTFQTTTPGEYRLVFNLTLQADEHQEPLTGDYRSENTFTVTDGGGGENQPPEVGGGAPDIISLSVGGGPKPFLPAAIFSDPDGDELEFSVAMEDTSVASAEVVVDTAGHTVVIVMGEGVGTTGLNVVARDPEDLTADLNITLAVDDSGFTPFPLISVANGVIILRGRNLAVCAPPIINTRAPDGRVYTVHASRWQGRADSSSEWADIEGTERTTGILCPYTARAAGEYRQVYEASILVDPHIDPIRGWYRTNSFTVSGGE